MIGKILIDNQNIFNLDDPKDDTRLFRLAEPAACQDPS